MRKQTESERELFNKILSVQFPGRDELARMLESSLVSDLDEIGGLKIYYSGEEIAPTVKQIPVEGELTDRDGVTVHALLHVRHGRPAELEIYRDDSLPPLAKINPKNLSVFVLSPYKG